MGIVEHYQELQKVFLKNREMEDKREKILYLHGLESKLSEAKREFLNDYGDVVAPDLNYHADSKVLENLLGNFQNEKFDVVMGSSMGGFIGFYLAKYFGARALLFNPALPYRSVEQQIPKLPEFHQQPVQIVIGVKDPLIKATDSLGFLAKNLPKQSMFDIHLRNDLEHRIPMDIFIQEVDFFYREY